MKQGSLASRNAWWLAAVCLSLLACNLLASGSPGTVPSAPPAEPAMPSTQVPTTALQVPSPTAAATAEAPTFTPTPTQGPPPLVQISAVGGRLNVRRGPGPEYDTVGAFLDGQSSNAVARNDVGTWVLINTPNTSKPLGWITLETKYTTVTGSVAVLPPQAVPPAEPAYIRNCTGREMLVNPTGAILLPKGSAPENQVQFFPGEYTVIDMETEKEVAAVTVFEGKTLDIKEDSSGHKFACN